MSTRHDRREKDRAKRAKKRTARPRGRGAMRLPRWVAPLVIAGVAGLAILGLRAAGFFEPPPPPVDLGQIQQPSEEIGTREPDAGNAHADRGQQIQYTKLPPTSGSHWAVPHAGWGVKDTPQEDELVLHNLEHGGIAIQYKPGLEAQQLADLKTLVRQLNGQGFPKVLLRPYAEMDKQIVATAWTWRLELDRFDREQLVRFVRSHYGANGNAPEPNAQ